jgi:hypothetical protein
MTNCSMSNKILKAQKKPRNSPTILLAHKWRGIARSPTRYKNRIPSNLQWQYRALQQRHKPPSSTSFTPESPNNAVERHTAAADKQQSRMQIFQPRTRTLYRVSRRGRGCGWAAARRARRGEPGADSTQQHGGDEEADEETPDAAGDGARKRRGRRRASAIGGFTAPGAR